MNDRVKTLIKDLELVPHPEGGYFRETYRSDLKLPDRVLPDSIMGERNSSTCIYFLLTAETFSAFHRIKQDEIWHFYQGDPLCIHMIDQNGSYSTVILTSEIFDDKAPQYVVPAGTWFAAEVTVKNGFALVGCTVSPGFDFADFELASADKLIEQFPEHKKIIERLT